VKLHEEVTEFVFICFLLWLLSQLSITGVPILFLLM